MKIPFPDDLHCIHEFIVPIRWGDMDAMGHVNNATYFRYMECARIDWFGSVGFQPNPKGEGPVIGNVFCNFLHQLEYPGDVLVRTHVGRIGNSSIDTWQTLSLTSDPQRICANGGATVVWVDFQRGSSAPLPDEVRRRLDALQPLAQP